MKKILLLSLFALFMIDSNANASYTYQRGYYKPSSGTYVQGHTKTKANNTKLDNLSCQNYGRCY